MGFQTSNFNLKRAKRNYLTLSLPCLENRKLRLESAILAIMLSLCPITGHTANIPDNQAIRAIIGESGNQGERGMLAVACAIRNRGTLRGVYGLKAKHIDKEPSYVWAMARKAWQESANKDVTGGATHWENIKAFGKPYWVKSMVKVYEHKDHIFYREKI